MNNDNGNYYSIIPSYVMEYPAKRAAGDNRPVLTSTDKLVYGKIASLTSSKGYCWANNKTIGAGCGIKPATATKCIGNLIEAGFIARKITRNERQEVIKRYLTLKQPEFSDEGTNNDEISEVDNTPIESGSMTPPVSDGGTPPLPDGKERLKVLDTTTTAQASASLKEYQQAVYTEHPLAYYQRTWGHPASGILNMEISDLANKYGSQLVNYAFYLAGRQGKPYAYAKAGLLDNWAKEKLDTIQKVADNRAKYQAQKKQRKSSRYNQQQSNVTPIDTHQTTLNDRIRSVFVNNNGDVNAVIKQFAIDDITVTAEQIRGVMNERA